MLSWITLEWSQGISILQGAPINTGIQGVPINTGIQGVPINTGVKWQQRQWKLFWKLLKTSLFEKFSLLWSAVLKMTWTKFVIFWYFCVLIEDDLKSSLKPLSFCFNFSCSIYDTMYNYFNYLEFVFLQKSWFIVQFSKDIYNLFNLLHYCLWIIVLLMVNHNLYYFWKMNMNYCIPKDKRELLYS